MLLGSPRDDRRSRDAELVARGLRPVQRSATICTPMPRKVPECLMRPNNRSTFNVALGIEAQGFCVLSK